VQGLAFECVRQRNPIYKQLSLRDLALTGQRAEHGTTEFLLRVMQHRECIKIKLQRETIKPQIAVNVSEFYLHASTQKSHVIRMSATITAAMLLTTALMVRWGTSVLAWLTLRP